MKKDEQDNVRDIAAQRLAKARENAVDLDDDDDERKSKVKRLVALFAANGRLVSDDIGEVYFVPRGAMAMPIKSQRFSDMIVAGGRKLGMTLEPKDVTGTVLNLRGEALASNQRIVPGVRIVGDGRAIYLHLGGDDVAVVTADGWTVESWQGRLDAPAAFVETNGYQRLPTPVRGGTVHELRDVLNVGDEGFALIVMWMLSALRPQSACPILTFVGPKGSAKSTATRVVRSMIDPNAIPLRAVPRKESDLGVAAKHSHVLAFDNLSGLGNDMSDALCRTATGGGLGTRTLYTTTDETVLKVLRPIILNGIDDLGSRADLGSRMYLAHLEEPKVRKTDQQIDDALAAMAPRVLGALLDALCVSMRDVSKVEAPLFRMTAAAQWAIAAEQALGFTAGIFLSALEASAANLREIAIEASPVGPALEAWGQRMALGGEPWEGSASALEAAIKPAAYVENWPKGSARFAVELNRISSDVAGLRITRCSIGRGPTRRNGYKVERV